MSDRPYYELQTSDVGKALITAFGRQWVVARFIGKIFDRDVGKHVFLVSDDVIQVENDDQRNARLGKAGTDEAAQYTWNNAVNPAFRDPPPPVQPLPGHDQSSPARDQSSPSPARDQSSKKVADTLSRRTLAAEGPGDPLKIGASIPVTLIREAFEQGGAPQAIKVGRQCFGAGDVNNATWDDKILAIAEHKATLRGFTPHVTYHDQPCATCKGTGETRRDGKQIASLMPCPTCKGDGFAPPNTGAA